MLRDKATNRTRPSYVLILELSDRYSKIVKINRFKDLVEKVDNIYKHKALSNEMETIKKSQKEILEIK